MKNKSILSFLVLTFAFSVIFVASAFPQVPDDATLGPVASTTLVISQAYGGGGGSTGTYLNDYVELKNISSTVQSLNGLSLMYGSASGQFGSSSTNIFALPNANLNPGQFYLVQLGSAGSGGVALPVTPDTSTTNLSMSGTSGKVALVTSAFVSNACGATATPCTLPNAAIVDVVSWGASNNAEGNAPTNAGAAITSTQGNVRKGSGCTDADNNNSDFDIITGPVPHNMASTVSTCSAAATTAPHVFTTVLNGANEVPANSSTATGFGRVVLNAAETQITASVYWNNIGPGATSAHIHGPAAVGVNGSILFNMQPTTATSGSSVDQVFTVTATDVANLRAGLLYFNVHSGTNFSGGEIRGQLGPIPAKSDFDGDGKTDYGVVRSGSGSNPNQLAWYIKLNGGGDIRRDWGLNTDIVTPADYDGDGKEDIAVWRQSPAPSYFYVLRSSDSTFTITAFGVSGDIPISRDYTGDGKADLAVYRSTDSTFWYNPSSGPFLGHPVEVPFGVPGDFPDPGDFNGDGKADFCVFHNTNNGTGTFNIRYGTDSVAAGSPDTTTYFGRFTTDSIISGDFDGDGKADIAVTRPESGKIVWYYLPSTGGGYQRLGWGVTGDLQVPGDYDGDGKTDFAIWRPSQTSGATAFYVLGSTSGFLFQPWGLSSDTPVNFDVLQ